MEQCPKCQSKSIHPSRSRSKWERWRREITGKRPFRCTSCGWRGWGIDRGPSFDEVQRLIAEQALSERPNLERAGLARDGRRSKGVDLDALDTITRDDE